MNISPIRNVVCSFFCVNSIDEEHRRIMEKLLSLGIQPSGNKAADKAKLHSYEMRQLKTEIGINGKGTVNKTNYLTVSANEIEQIIDNRKANNSEPEVLKQENNEEVADNYIGATQEALLNKYFLLKENKKT